MERMKEFILSPEEIYYIGKVSGGKYLDYDYIAAMKDIGKRGKIKQQEILDSLERKGYAQEDFLGNLEVEPACIEILQPLYQGMYESELILREEAGESVHYKFHHMENRITSVECRSQEYRIRVQDKEGIERMLKVFGGEAGEGISSGQVQGVIDVIEDYRKAEKTSKKAKAKSKKKKDSFLNSLKADVAGVSKAIIKKGKKTVSKIKKSYDEKGFVYKALQYGKAAVKVGEGVVKIAGAVALVAGSGGAALPVATCLALSACNDVYNAMMDATYTYTGDFNKIGNTNLLKEFLVKQGRETGEALFGDKKLGETMGNWVYTGLDIVSFLNGVDQLGKSFGKFQTAITGTAGTSKVWGEIHMKDVIENTHKLYKKDGIIKTVLRIDPTSVGNFGYDVVTGAMKAIQSAGKLGSTIADLAFG